MTSKKKDVSVILSTCPPSAADGLASFLVENRLAACVNIIPEVRSVYRWEGRVEHDAESLLVIKCAAERQSEVTRALVAEHPYDVPEVVSLAVAGGNDAYLSWVLASSQG